MKKCIKKSAVLFVIAVLIIGLSIPVINHSHNKALAISEPAYYSRINFNVKSKTGTMPISYVKDFLISNDIVPLRVWILIDNDITAMFTYQEDWNLKTFDRNIRKDIMKNYALRLKYDSDSLKKNLNNQKLHTSYEKLVQQDERILKNISNPSYEIKVLAVDIAEKKESDSFIKETNYVKKDLFSVSELQLSDFLISPQFQWQVGHKYKKIAKINIFSYNPGEYPADNTWLPNYVSTDIRTLRDASQTRYINQTVEWFSNSRMSFFKHFNSTYEQDTVFWLNEQGKAYVSFSNPITQWYSNFPNPYEDSRILDSGNINLSIGCGYGRDLVSNKEYYYTIYAKRGELCCGNELEVQEQPGHYFGYPSGLTVDSYKTYTHFSELNPGYIPNYYYWYQNP